MTLAVMVSEESVGGEFVAERPGDRRGGRVAGRDEGGDVLFKKEKSVDESGSEKECVDGRQKALPAL